MLSLVSLIIQEPQKKIWHLMMDDNNVQNNFLGVILCGRTQRTPVRNTERIHLLCLYARTHRPRIGRRQLNPWHMPSRTPETSDLLRLCCPVHLPLARPTRHSRIPPSLLDLLRPRRLPWPRLCSVLPLRQCLHLKLRHQFLTGGERSSHLDLLRPLIKSLLLCIILPHVFSKV